MFSVRGQTNLRAEKQLISIRLVMPAFIDSTNDLKRFAIYYYDMFYVFQSFFLSFDDFLS